MCLSMAVIDATLAEDYLHHPSVSLIALIQTIVQLLTKLGD
jgi:hypothetical protein